MKTTRGVFWTNDVPRVQYNAKILNLITGISQKQNASNIHIFYLWSIELKTKYTMFYLQNCCYPDKWGTFYATVLTYLVFDYINRLEVKTLPVKLQLVLQKIEIFISV